MEALALSVAFVMGLLTYGLLKLCEWLLQEKPGGRS